MKTVLNSLWQAAGDAGLERPRQMVSSLATLVSQARWLLLLLARLYVARVFWLSGLSKLRDWEITLALFQDEYHVPGLPPELAAWLGTGGELVLPVLLVLGLATRLAAAGLSVVNVVAVLSLAEIAPAALLGHQLWGALLLMLLICGAGRWSLDGWRAGTVTRAAGT